MRGARACGPRFARQGGNVIAFLRGRVLESDAESAVLDVAGVGYQVLVSAGTAGALPAVGAETSLYVHTHFVERRAPSPLRVCRRRRAPSLSDLDRRAGRRSSGGPRHLGRAGALRTGSGHRHGGRSAAHPGEGRGTQDRRAVGARAAREDPHRASGEGRRPCGYALGEPHPVRPARRRGGRARPAWLQTGGDRPAD